MPATSLHKPTGRWLTSSRFSTEPWKAGDTPTLSIGHPLLGGEFTTYRLAEPVAHDEDGTPLFDLREADIEIGRCWSQGLQFWATRAEIEAVTERHPSDFELQGIYFQRTAFGQYRAVERV